MNLLLVLFVFLFGASQLSAQFKFRHLLSGANPAPLRPLEAVGKQKKMLPALGINLLSPENGGSAKTPLWAEFGYVLAMETFFTGMSYLASKEKPYGRRITGGFDSFMGVAGLLNSTQPHSGLQSTGYYLITAGFFAKALYNFHFSKNHTAKDRFWTNFVGFNVLVFTGYYLDTLK